MLLGVSGWFIGRKEGFVEDWMDLLPRSGEFEAICGESFFAEDFEGAIPLFSQFLARSRRGDVGSLQPDSVSFVVITSVSSSFVVKCFHCLGGLGEGGLCLGSSLGEVVDEVLSRLALNFSTGFESFVGVSSVVMEEWRLSSRRLFLVVVRESGE